ncbi:hypothetical protein HDU99_008319 [Rhizoclosmatium hyalinum]|nr:hypothetical protein HDU99_008319 [Rhizoclosmatium hyalinum]
MVDAHRLLYGPYNVSTQGPLCIIILLIITLVNEYQTQTVTSSTRSTTNINVITSTHLTVLLFTLIESTRIGASIGTFSWTIGSMFFGHYVNRPEWASCLWIAVFLYRHSNESHNNWLVSVPETNSGVDHVSHAINRSSQSRGFLARGKVVGVGAGLGLYLAVNQLYGVGTLPWTWIGGVSYLCGWFASFWVGHGKQKKSKRRRNATDDARSLYLLAASVTCILYWIQMLDVGMDIIGGVDWSAGAFSSDVILYQMLVLAYGVDLGLVSGILAVLRVWVISLATGPATALILWIVSAFLQH